MAADKASARPKQLFQMERPFENYLSLTREAVESHLKSWYQNYGQQLTDVWATYEALNRVLSQLPPEGPEGSAQITQHFTSLTNALQQPTRRLPGAQPKSCRSSP